MWKFSKVGGASPSPRPRPSARSPPPPPAPQVEVEVPTVKFAMGFPNLSVDEFLAPEQAKFCINLVNSTSYPPGECPATPPLPPLSNPLAPIALMYSFSSLI